MDSTEKPKTGTAGWFDLTIPNGDAVRDFYQGVIGWTSEPTDMDGYDDYSTIAPGTGECVAGVCHARGCNADLPPQWLYRGGRGRQHHKVQGNRRRAYRRAEIDG
jgi:predicted enzyme related to lactoylglutathione lyase